MLDCPLFPGSLSYYEGEASALRLLVPQTPGVVRILGEQSHLPGQARVPGRSSIL